MKIITINDKNYELKLNIGRVKALERRSGKPIFTLLLGNDGQIALSDLALIYGWCLKPEGSDAFVMPAEGEALLEQDITDRGYLAVVKDVFMAAKEGLPFLFKMS